MEKPPLLDREEGAFQFQKAKRRALVSNAAPHFIGIDLLVRVQPLGSLQEDFGRFRIGGIGDAAIVHGADGRALRFVEVPHAFGAALVGDDIDVVSDALPITDVVALSLRVAPGLKDGLVWTLGEAGPAGNALFGDQ
jgi:hypothetical protein